MKPITSILAAILSFTAVYAEAIQPSEDWKIVMSSKEDPATTASITVPLGHCKDNVRVIYERMATSCIFKTPEGKISIHLVLAANRQQKIPAFFAFETDGSYIYYSSYPYEITATRLPRSRN